MPIIYHESARSFHLYNDQISYIMQIMGNEQLEHIYFGKRLRDRESYRHLHRDYMRSQMAICLPEPSLLSMHYTMQEYPAFGTGDFRSPAYQIQDARGSIVSNFVYQGHEIRAGKPALEGLPHTYGDETEVETLIVHLKDEMSACRLDLIFSIFAQLPVITRSARFCQEGEEELTLTRALSTSLEFADGNFRLMQLSGAWGRERYVELRDLPTGISAIQGLNGTCSGAEENPFLALLRPECTEERGEVYGVSLIYSSNFLAQVERSTFGLTRLTMGIHPDTFSWPLGKGDCFQTPEAVMVYSDQGLGGMSRSFHQLWRKQLIRGAWKNQAKPILLNNWEATFFDFDQEKLLGIAAKAKEVGVELFVLDDGWFGRRTSDRAGLGDWYANRDRLPEGIQGLSEKIEAMGLKFGLWVELEMVNKDSDLYLTHPEWMISTPGRYESHSRHQHVLDFSRPELVDYLYEQIAELLRSSKISYIKWDMNRYMTEPYGKALTAKEQGGFTHRYILGVYQLYERLTKDFPQVLFESCASGGARFDPGLFYYAPQAWCSDDTDAGERMKIQYGTSMVYPLTCIGSHVSAVPNLQLARSTPLETRAAVAYFGTFGYELDLNLLSEAEIEEVKRQILFMKKYRGLIQQEGAFYRLKSPFEGDETAWMVVSEDASQALAAYYQSRNHINDATVFFRLAGLDPGKYYQIRYDRSPVLGHRFESQEAEERARQQGYQVTYQSYGDELMQVGVPLTQEELNQRGGDYASLLFEIQELNR